MARPPAAESLQVRPPTRSRASSTATVYPSATSMRAVVRPAKPAPTTQTSTSSLAVGISAKIPTDGMFCPMVPAGRRTQAQRSATTRQAIIDSARRLFAGAAAAAGGVELPGDPNVLAAMLLAALEEAVTLLGGEHPPSKRAVLRTVDALLDRVLGVTPVG